MSTLGASATWSEISARSTQRVDQSQVFSVDEPVLAGYEAVYRDRYAHSVRLAALVTGDKDHAEEIAQDAFVALYRGWATVADPNAYLYTAVVNRARDHVRRRQTRRMLVDRLRRNDRTVDAEPDLAGAFEHYLVSLSTNQRTAISLRYYCDLTPDEVADVMHARPSTVRSWLKRGLESIRKEVGHDGSAS